MYMIILQFKWFFTCLVRSELNILVHLDTTNRFYWSENWGSQTLSIAQISKISKDKSKSWTSSSDCKSHALSSSLCSFRVVYVLFYQSVNVQDLWLGVIVEMNN